MNNFNELPLQPEILRAIEELGYTAPTPIQAATLPLLLAGDTDFLGLAATGTGKTAAFGIPLLQRLERDVRGVQALVLCPTRELAIQVAGQIDLLGKNLGVRALPIYGGTGYGDQLHGLKAGATIVVGTPGRVVDHIEKGSLRLANLRTLVLDEADEMISMGFKEDLEKVLQSAPSGQANIWLFSATMGTDVKHVADEYLSEPQRVQINRTEMLSTTVEQIYYKTHEYDKPALLCRLIDVADDFYGIVFCQTKALVADVHQFLVSKGYRADSLHGDLEQKERDRVMQSFRDHKISILVATDVACRGLDVKDITHVVNYSIPRELENYVHRIGRTARSGKQGLAISLVTYSHRELIGRIERMTKSTMREGVPPSQKDVATRRVVRLRQAFEKAGNQGRATALMASEWKEILAGMSPEEVAGRFAALMMPDLFVDAPREEKPQLSKSSHSVRPEKSAPPPRRAPRPFGGPSHSGPSHGGAGKKPFHARKPFEARKPHDTRTPPWERKEGSGPDKPQHSAPGSRWKNNFSSKPRPNQAEAFASEAGAEPADRKDKKKKKPYGHWKSKKDGHAPSKSV